MRESRKSHGSTAVNRKKVSKIFARCEEGPAISKKFSLRGILMLANEVISYEKIGWITWESSYLCCIMRKVTSHEICKRHICNLQSLAVFLPKRSKRFAEQSEIWPNLLLFFKKICPNEIYFCPTEGGTAPLHHLFNAYECFNLSFKIVKYFTRFVFSKKPSSKSNGESFWIVGDILVLKVSWLHIPPEKEAVILAMGKRTSSHEAE